MRLTLETVVSGLLEDFPELQPAYEWETRAGEEGAYVIFDDVVWPYVEDLLSDASPEPSQALRRLFRFLEELASADNRDLRDLVAESIIEQLKADPTRMKRARAVMGPSTRELARERPPRQRGKRS
jgi:hypothetical protein